MKGLITFYDPGRFFGIIEDEAGNTHFFFNPKRRNAKTPRYYPGDEVEFELIPDEQHPSKNKARILNHKNGQNYTDLLQLLENEPRTTGYLRKLPNGNWAIKQMPSGIFIEVNGPSPLEEDVEFIYENRLNEKVEVIVKVNKKKKMSAVLADRRLSQAYYKAAELKESKKVVQAKVTGQNDDVVFLETLEGAIPCIILKSESHMDHSILKRGQFYSIRIKTVSDTMIKGMLDG